MARRHASGPEAPFPELGNTTKALFYDLMAKPEVLSVAEKSPLVSALRSDLAHRMLAAIEEDTFGYTSTIHLIEEATALFDIVVRVNDSTSPPPYHSARFEYNWHSLSEDEGHTVLPTTASVNPVDLLKLRGVPVGIVGVTTDTLTVDGYPQTPYEFFHHDIDHTRRMHQESVLAIEREGVTPEKYAQDATDLLYDELLPAIDIAGVDDQDERDLRIAMRMILFEILHEDGTDPTKDSIADGLLRPPMERTPFERMANDTTVEHYMAPRASTLAHVYRKLAHTFYDVPERRTSNLGTDFVRTRVAIAEGAARLYRLVSDDPTDDASLLSMCEKLVSTDEGFTDGFLGSFAHDVKRRAVGSNALKLMITRPLGVAAAVRKVRSYRPQVHSLFGYSALEYEDPEQLERTVLADLAAFDPTETAIAIGATPYGIGRLYPAIKDLGFFTLGVVASTAVGKNEETAEGVDSIIVVKDNGWGGYRYSQDTAGLLSPTTRVFAGASDSMAAYGGGTITAVTLQEMLRRDKPVDFKPFDMNHRLAAMMQAQRGDDLSSDFAGPADAKWHQLQGNR
jgi:hypothetical protein